MKSAAVNFSTFYNQQIVPFQEKFQEDEQNAKSCAGKTAAFLTLPAAAGFLILYFSCPDMNIFIYFIGSIIFLFFSWILVYQATRGDREEVFYYEILPLLIRFINPVLKYGTSQHIALSCFMDSSLFPKPDRFSGEHLIYGEIQGVEQAFSWFHAEHKHVQRSKDKTTVSWNDIFKGVFFYAEFNKNFHGTTLVVPDRTSFFWGETIGRFIQKINWNGLGKLAVMENPEFEKKYTVYTTDQIEARYILTPKLMCDIVSLPFPEWIDAVSFSFHSGKIFIAFHTEKSPFLYQGQNLTCHFMREIYQKILFFTTISQRLNLDLRIWTKQ